MEWEDAEEEDEGDDARTEGMADDVESAAAQRAGKTVQPNPSQHSITKWLERRREAQHEQGEG